MFNKVSVAGTGMVTVLIVFVLHALGVDVEESFVDEAVKAALVVVGFVVWVYGQLIRKDFKFGLFRK